MTARTSDLLDLRLFVGICQEQVVCKNVFLLEHFTAGGPYLTKKERKGKVYLGKEISQTATMQQLEDVESHVLSLLRKLHPSSTFTSLEIFGY